MLVESIGESDFIAVAWISKGDGLREGAIRAELACSVSNSDLNLLRIGIQDGISIRKGGTIINLRAKSFNAKTMEDQSWVNVALHGASKFQ